LKKYIPTICVLVLLAALALSIPALQNFAAHASSPSVAQASGQGKAHAATLGSTSATSSSMSYVPACSQAPAGYARCMAMVSTTTVQPTFAKPMAHSNVAMPGGSVLPAAQPTGSAAPYGPTALHNAYNLPTTAATTQTIAIVDAFDDPNAEADLGTYRQMFGIPACTTANGCFRKVNQTGGATPPTTNTSWGVEISLDLDMASAICQNCHILLVEANSASLADLGAAVNEAVTLGANEVSNSYGTGEFAGESADCSSFYSHPGVAVTASSGDFGLGVEFPSACPNVTGVGGTTLNTNGTETAWNTSATQGAGGGCSAQIAIPAWEVQTVTNCATRAVSDVSAVADPNTGVYIFDTFGQGGGLQVGGNSASSTIIAATFALAGGSANATSSASIPWMQRNAGCLNTVGGVTYAFQSGLGSPKGITCF
jgi:subtilase family serine protease